MQIYEVGEHHGLAFFSLEDCAGGSLEKKLAGTPLPAREAAALVEPLARAMQAAHQRGVIHRDLKPANVLLQTDSLPQKGTKDAKREGARRAEEHHGPLLASPFASFVPFCGQAFLPKITDFGLAKKLDEAGQTASGAVMGTPSYMAPEQAGGQKDQVGPPADVYALGAILYECLMGRPPFKAAMAMNTLIQGVADNLVPQWMDRRDLIALLTSRKFSPPITEAILRALEPLACQQFQNLDEAVQWFQSFEPEQATPSANEP